MTNRIVNIENGKWVLQFQKESQKKIFDLVKYKSLLTNLQHI